MKLMELTDVILVKKIHGNVDVEVSTITDDSRAVVAGSLFVAMSGNHVDGHDFVAQAVAKGAVAILVEHVVDSPVPQIIVPSTRRVAPILAHRLLGQPAKSMTMIGVTGTNGKTTTTILIERILQEAHKVTGLIGTIEQRTSTHVLRESGMTTPQAIELTNLLKTMHDEHVEYVVMEASSHALELARIAGISYRVAAFTNLTQDHLDFHQTMDAYGRAKGHLFSRLGNDFDPLVDGGLPVAVLNADDPWSAKYENETVQQVLTYGIDNEADVRAKNLHIKAQGVQFVMETFAGNVEIALFMTGRFSVYNALCAAASTLALGIDLDTIKHALENTMGVPGRFERVVAGQPFAILVDYSHTPDSLENALTTIREFCTGRVITVVGAGGDRDKTKRPLMAQMAVKYSDFTVLTSDNPRTEDPEKILDDMEQGVWANPDKYTRLVSRTDGIRHAILMAKENDVILIAGKGHETYQIIGTTKHDYDDRKVAAMLVKEALL